MSVGENQPPNPEPMPSPPDPQAAPPAPSPEPPQPAPEPSGGGIRDYLTSKGYDVSDFKDDNDILEVLVERSAAADQLAELAQYGQRYQQHADEFERWRQENAEPEKPAEPNQVAWSPPEFDASWLQHLDFNPATNRYSPRSIEHASLAEKANRYREFRERTNDRFVRDPLGTLEEAGLGKRFQDLEQSIDQRVEERLKAVMAQQEQQRYFQEKQKELFVTDEGGNVRYDPRTGQPALTPKGQAFSRYSQEAQSMGLTDPGTVRRYAERMVEADEHRGAFGAPADPATPPNEPPPSGSEPPRDDKGRFLRRVADSGERPPEAPANPPQGSRRQSLSNIVNEEMKARGLNPEP
jgi:hypothetical protein